MTKAFDMIDLDLLHYCLGVEVWEIGSSIFVSQTNCARGLLDKLIITNCKFSFTPMEKGIKTFTEDRL
jgi:hypothetical protein